MDKRRSTSCYVFTLVGEPIYWMSKLQETMTLSITEAKYIAISHACKEEIWLKGLLGDFEKAQDKVNVSCGCQSVIQFANNLTYHNKANHIAIKYQFVR